MLAGALLANLCSIRLTSTVLKPCARRARRYLSASSRLSCAISDQAASPVMKNGLPCASWRWRWSALTESGKAADAIAGSPGSQACAAVIFAIPKNSASAKQPPATRATAAGGKASALISPSRRCSARRLGPAGVDHGILAFEQDRMLAPEFLRAHDP